jgi:dihydrofolate reductase
MKKILLVAMSVNGKIARMEEESSLRWTSEEDTAFFKVKTKQAKNIIMGHKTFQTINKGLPDRVIYVMTREKKLPGKMQPGVIFTNDSPEIIISKLEKRGEKECCIAGGRSVYEQFLELDLVDEIFLTVEPLLFKKGTGLCDVLTEDIRLSLLDLKKLNDSTILLNYKVERQ